LYRSRNGAGLAVRDTRGAVTDEESGLALRLHPETRDQRPEKGDDMSGNARSKRSAEPRLTVETREAAWEVRGQLAAAEA
jgi:hypothetical protein